MLIVRHAPHLSGRLTGEGLGAATAVGRALAEALRELPRQEAPAEWLIVAAETDESCATAAVLRAALGAPPVVKSARIRPADWSPFGGTQSLRTLDGLVKALETDIGGPAAGLVLVLHDPQAAWLVRALARRNVSLERGGIAWLVPVAGQGARFRRRGRWEVWSTIEPGEKDALVTVVKKVEVKYRTAGALGGFLTALVTFLAQRFGDRVDEAGRLEIVFWAGALACVGLGAVLNFAALLEYDRLQMPTRYWGAGTPRDEPALRPGRSRVVVRPPASAARVVVECSQRVWARLVVPSILLLGAGLVLLAGAVARPDGVEDLAGVLVAVVLLGLGVAAWYFARAPLGTSD